MRAVIFFTYSFTVCYANRVKTSNMPFAGFFPCAIFVLVTVCKPAVAYNGFNVGSLMHNDAAIGEVFIVNCKELLVKGYMPADMEAQGSVKFMALTRNSTEEPNQNGMDLQESEVMMQESETGTQHTVLSVPSGSTSTIKILYIWDMSKANSALQGSVTFPDQIEIPVAHHLGEFTDGIDIFGRVIAASDRELQVIKFYHTQTDDKNIYFYVGTTAMAETGMVGEGQKIIMNNIDEPLTTSSNETLCLMLPNNLTIFQVHYIALYDMDTQMATKYVNIPGSIMNGSVLVPPYMVNKNCLEAAGEKSECADYMEVYQATALQGGSAQTTEVTTTTAQTTAVTTTTAQTTGVTTTTAQTTGVTTTTAQTTEPASQPESEPAYGYKGVMVGQLQGMNENPHMISGNVYLASCDTIILSSFTIKDPGPVSMIRIRDSSADQFEITKGYDNATVLVEANKIYAGDVLEVHAGSQGILAEFVFDENLLKMVPMVQFIGPIDTKAHAVSGMVYVLNEKQILLDAFTYDGGGPDAFFYVGKGDKPDANGMKVPNELGQLTKLGGYEGATLCLTLPDELTVFDIEYFSVWCVAFKENFGHVMIPTDLKWRIPAWRNMSVCSSRDQNNCGISTPSDTTSQPAAGNGDATLAHSAGNGTDLGNVSVKEGQKFGYKGFYVGEMKGNPGDTQQIYGKMYFGNCAHLVMSEFTIRNPDIETRWRFHRGEHTVVVDKPIAEYINADFVIAIELKDGDIMEMFDSSKDKVLASYTFDKGPATLGPFVRSLGPLSEKTHGVKGYVYILNEKQIRLSKFNYDGGGPDAFFYVGNGKPDDNGIKVPNEKGELTVLGGYIDAELCLTLPDDLTVFDIDYFSVWCVAFSENFGDIEISVQKEEIPAWLNAEGCSAYALEKCGSVGYNEAGSQNGGPGVGNTKDGSARETGHQCWLMSIAFTALVYLASYVLQG